MPSCWCERLASERPRPGVPAAVLLVALVFCAACTSSDTGFSEVNARAHMQMLAGTIGSRPTGSDANRRAREYITARLRASGFDVEIQQAEAVRPELGLTVPVANIIATRPGRFDQAIALVSHYDSVADGPGASDDAVAVAVCLEAGRVLARREQPNHTLALVFTDGEEFGLMGAVALMKHPIKDALGAVLNFESIGSGGPDLLFQTDTPGDPLVRAWARWAPRPTGGSYAAEIYERMPNDTDFTVFKRAGIPGLNFAAVGDGYSYHTTRDAPGRVDPALIRDRGANTIAIVRAIDGTGDLTSGRRQPLTYFDVLRLKAFAYPWQVGLALFAAAMLAALFGWLTVLPVARVAARPAQMALTVAWTLVAAAAVFAAMFAAEWLLRATRETYHPWYAHPDRFFVFLALAGILAGRAVVCIGRALPRRARGSTHPAVAWLVTLPAWAALAIAAQIVVPLASYLVVIPLLAAGAALAASPVRRVAGLRVASAIALAVSGTIWIPDAIRTLRFAVPTYGFLPIVTPLVVYPALLTVAALFVAPPLLAVIGRAESDGAAAGSRSPVRATMLIAAALALAAASIWFAPAYTHERPLRASVSYVNDRVAGAYWHIASNEPGAAVGTSAPVAGSWRTGLPLRRGELPLPLSRAPFQLSAPARTAHAPPATAVGSLRVEGESALIEVRVVPERPGLAVAIGLPPDVMPEETTLAMRRQVGERPRFSLRYAALPPEGIAWRARVPAGNTDKLASGIVTTVTVVSPGVPGAEWPQLPRWLPQDHVAWQARSYFTFPVRCLAVALGQ